MNAKEQEFIQWHYYTVPLIAIAKRENRSDVFSLRGNLRALSYEQCNCKERSSRNAINSNFNHKLDTVRANLIKESIPE